MLYRFPTETNALSGFFVVRPHDFHFSSVSCYDGPAGEVACLAPIETGETGKWLALASQEQDSMSMDGAESEFAKTAQPSNAQGTLELPNVGAVSARSAMPQTRGRPFLKWAGGKRQLLDQFEHLYPEELKRGEIETYCEPFIGGGAVYMDIASRYRIPNIVLMDKNQDLVACYKAVQIHVDELVVSLGKLSDDYFRTATDAERERMYYSIRARFNGTKPGSIDGDCSREWIERAAELLFLNKTCYNGLYRVNRKGEFNSPFGKYRAPAILDERNLRAVSDGLRNVTIMHADFERALEFAKPGCFIYCDPPYRPLSRTSSFNAYTVDVFDDSEQLRLARFAGAAARKGALVMLSNSDPKTMNPDDSFFEDAYSEFAINRVQASRSLNSKSTGRGPITEIVATSYIPGFRRAERMVA